MTDFDYGNLTEVQCSRCGRDCWRDSADVGVGVIYGPWGCPCGWSESAEYDVTAGPKLTSEGYELDQWGGATPAQILESEIR